MIRADGTISLSVGVVEVVHSFKGEVVEVGVFILIGWGERYSMEGWEAAAGRTHDGEVCSEIENHRNGGRRGSR